MTLTGVAIAGLLVPRPEPAPLETRPMTAPVNVIKVDAARPIALTDELDETEQQFAVTTATLENIQPPPPLERRPLTAGD
jgi:hypothetical protein